ncbi:hypothetical protein [Microbacterium sp.]|uniref:hypothetical protein n=1 Tax=Microbacterium sp. TaxID=51671 RepID=UPI0027335C4C|nr:hypothetical protein [Microbacterium sp.]MDP3953194.1 hypothetical protein [Microbacterium sp.]
MKSLKALLSEVQTNGIAATDGGLERLEREARVAGWTPVASRRGGKEIEILEPTKEEDAHRRSLSARYGTGRQPLHSDCAHHRVPPGLLLLSVDEPSDVPTLLWGFESALFSGQQLADMRDGLFTVRAGSSAFLAPALDRGHLRFDPVCMTPSDPRAARTAALLADVTQSSTPFNWNVAGRVLAINNHRFLHARDDASGEPSRAIKRLAIRVKEEESL